MCVNIDDIETSIIQLYTYSIFYWQTIIKLNRACIIDQVMDKIIMPELIANILDFVPDIRKCQINRLWRECVICHNDYVALWSKHYIINKSVIVKYGSVKMIELYNNIRATEWLSIGAEVGNLRFIKYIRDNYIDINNDDLSVTHQIACKHGKLDVALYLHQYAGHADISLSKNAIKACDAVVLQYVSTKYRITNMSDILKFACELDNVDIVRYAYAKQLANITLIHSSILCIIYNDSCINVIQLVAKHGSLNVLQYLGQLNSFSDTQIKNILYYASEFGHINIIQHYIRPHDIYEVFINACKCDQLNVVEYLVANHNTYILTYRYGHLLCIKYACMKVLKFLYLLGNHDDRNYIIAELYKKVSNIVCQSGCMSEILLFNEYCKSITYLHENGADVRDIALALVSCMDRTVQYDNFMLIYKYIDHSDTYRFKVLTLFIGDENISAVQYHIATL